MFSEFFSTERRRISVSGLYSCYGYHAEHLAETFVLYCHIAAAGINQRLEETVASRESK